MHFEFDIHLKWSDNPTSPSTDAWLIVGNSVERWVIELHRHSLDTSGLLLYYLPQSRSDRATGSLFVVGELPSPTPNPWVQPYRRLGTRLFIPRDATLSAPLDGHEIDQLLPYPLVVFHPHLGLVGFEEHDVHEFHELISIPDEVPTGFSWARPGYPLQDRLLAITPLEPLRMELVFEGGREDISSRPAKELPPVEGETKIGGVRGVGRYVQRRLLEGLRRLTEFAPESGTKPTWINHTRDWADERLQKLQDRQRREIQRLIHLLRNNPDEGLRFALPLAGDRHRGVARPSSSLPKKNIDFSLNHFQGGYAVSPWMIDWGERMELLRQYRDAANREIRLGRFRRAAYIFAELLNEPREAANVLRQGGHYREAAIVYLKQLKDPLEAAHCLLEGGFPKEALPLFEEKQQYELAARIYRECGDHMNAEKCYRRAISRHLSHQQSILAAKILEKELNSLDEAIGVLHAAWPEGSDALTCLNYEMDLYARHGLVDLALARIDSITEGVLGNRAVGLLKSLSVFSSRYPIQEVRENARDRAFILASDWMSNPEFQQKGEILTLLHRLVPDDRLLRRDAQRYRQIEEEKRRNATHQPTRVTKTLELVDSHPLPTGIQWTHFHPRGRAGFYGVGRSSQGSVVMRHNWAGHNQIVAFSHPLPEYIQLAAAPESHPEILSILGVNEFPETALAPSDHFTQALRIENPAWCRSEGFLGMCFSPGGVAWALHRSEEEELILSSFSKMGDLIATRALHLPDTVSLDPWNLIAPFPMVSAREQIFVALGHHLIRFHRDQTSILTFNHPILELTPSASYTRLRIAVIFEFGAELCWADSEWGRQHSLPLHLERPHIAFTPTGNLLVASPGRLDVLENSPRGYIPLFTQEMETATAPMAVFHTEEHQVFAVLMPTSVVRYRICG